MVLVHITLRSFFSHPRKSLAHAHLLFLFSLPLSLIRRSRGSRSRFFVFERAPAVIEPSHDSFGAAIRGLNIPTGTNRNCSFVYLYFDVNVCCAITAKQEDEGRSNRREREREGRQRSRRVWLLPLVSAVTLVLFSSSIRKDGPEGVRGLPSHPVARPQSLYLDYWG